jgi:serine/threonine protein kinase
MSKTRNKRYKSSKTRTRKTTGGSVLASGGFGCVFSPALLCKGQTKRKQNTVSKLMTEKHALEEYNDISDISEHLKTIKNYKDYFLVDNVSICTPKPLSVSDLSNFKKKCTALPKDGITVSNINQHLDDIMSLNIPNGGIDVDDYVFENGSFVKLLNLNTKLISLLNNGIIPMNKHNVYHSDIKGSNILIDPSLKTRLIDWGLCAKYKPFKNKTIPSTWHNRPLQFNVPFSVILFTKVFNKNYREYIQGGGKLDRDNLRLFVWDYIQAWKKIRGVGHYRVINDTMYMLFSNDLNINQSMKWNEIEKKYTIPYLVDYLVEILLHYKQMTGGSYDATPYLDEVFVNIVDIWGFLSTYTTIIEVLFNNYSILNTNERKLFDSLKRIIVEYMYKPCVKPINIPNLTKELVKLNAIFVREDEVANKVVAIRDVNPSSKISYKRKSKKQRRGQPLLLMSKNSKSLIREVAEKYM